MTAKIGSTGPNKWQDAQQGYIWIEPEGGNPGYHILIDQQHFSKNTDDAGWTEEFRNSSPFTNVSPSNRLNDGDADDTHIYIPVYNTADLLSKRIVKYLLSDFSYVDHVDTPSGPGAATLAVDEVNGLIYLSGFSNTTVDVWTTDLVFVRNFTVSPTVSSIQGSEFINGLLQLVSTTGNLYHVDVTTGQVVWSQDIGNEEEYEGLSWKGSQLASLYSSFANSEHIVNFYDGVPTALPAAGGGMFEVVRFELATATGNQDIIIPGFGTPKAVIIFGTGAVANDTPRVTAYTSIGFSDGTNEVVTGQSAGGAVGTTLVSRTQSNAKILSYPSPSTASIIVEAEFVAFITDGVRINNTIASGSGLEAFAILIGGDEVTDAYVGATKLATSASATDITAVGFEPDLVFMMGTANSAAVVSAGQVGHQSFGVGINDGSDTQRCSIIGSVDNVAASVVNTMVSNTDIVGQIYNNSNAWNASIGSYDANGFTLTPDASPGGDWVYYLCIELSADVNIDLFDVTIPTTGNYAETAPGFEPEFGFLSIMDGPTSRNSMTTSGGAAMTFSAFDAGAIASLSHTDQDAAATTVAYSMYDSTFNLLSDDGSTRLAEASSYAFDADGWDFTLSTNPASSALGWGLAVGASGSAVTGDGTPSSQSATSSGSASVAITGSGSAQAQAASANGVAGLEVAGSGASLSENATSSGAAAVEISGSGSASSQNATTSGNGAVGSAISGNGTAQAQAATSSGLALVEVTGSGTPSAQEASTSGTGVVGTDIVASGSPQAQAATCLGTATITVVGTGAPAANDATSSGSATVLGVIEGSGSPQSQSATSSGTANLLVVITGSGICQSQSAACNGFDSFIPSPNISVVPYEQREFVVNGR